MYIPYVIQKPSGKIKTPMVYIARALVGMAVKKVIYN